MPRRSPSGPLALLALALAGGPRALPAQTADAFPAAMGAQVDSLVRRALALDGRGALTIGVVTDSGLAWTRSYGYADAARRIPAGDSTVYRIGSITKQFTALMLLRLVHSGAVQLSDPVDRYLPAIDSVRDRPAGAPAITLVQLATMRSGLAQEPDSTATFTQGPLRAWERTLEAALRRTHYTAGPGARWEYSNIGYAALGAALERAAGRPYLEYVPEEILRPLGMAHTVFELDVRARAHLATGFTFDGGAPDTLVPRRELSGRGYKVPNGGLFSTVADLARFLAFEMGNGPEGVLPAAQLKENYTRIAYATPDLTQGYGLGFHMLRRGTLVAFGHPGSVAGYLATAYFDPASHTGVVVLRSVDDPKFDILGFTMDVLERAVAARKRPSR